MENSNEIKEFVVREDAGDVVFRIPQSFDVTIAEYLPDIKKLLFCVSDAEQTPPTFEDGRLKTSFTARFTLWYADDAGEIRSFDFEHGYADEKEFGGSADGAEVIFQNRAGEVSLRPLGKRKFSVRCEGGTVARILGEKLISPETVTKDKEGEDGQAELRSETKELYSLERYVFPDNRESRDVPLGSGVPSDAEILCRRLNVVPRECRVTEGAAECVFACEFAAVVGGAGEGENTAKEYASGFDVRAEFSLPEGTENAKGLCFANVTELEANLTRNDSGETVCELDFTYKVTLFVFKNGEKHYVSDAFSPAFESDAAFDAVRCGRIGDCVYTNATQNGKIERETEGCEMLFGDVRVGNFEAASEDGRAFVRGTLRADVILVTPEGPDLAGGECEFRLALPSENADALGLSCSAIGKRLRLERDGISFGAEIYVSCALCENEELEYVKTLRIDNTAQRSGENADRVRLVYPSDGETAWDVAKKYGVRRRDVVISPESERVMLIPKKK